MIVVDEVSKFFGSVVAVSDVSFGVGPGVTALLGVEGLVVVRAGDAVLVARRDRLDDLRELVGLLAAREGGRYL